MSQCPEPDSHIKDKVNVVLDLPIYDTKICQNMLKVLIHLSQLLKEISSLLKVKLKKLDFNRLVNVLTGLNTLKINVNYLVVHNLKIVPVGLTKLNVVVSKKGFKTQNSTN